MTGSVALDCVIGLVFIYLLYSMLASILQEMLATNLGLRAKVLHKAISRMLDDGKNHKEGYRDRLKSWSDLIFPSNQKDQTFTKEFYDHPLTKYLAEDNWHNKPSYLSSADFSKVLLDLLRANVKVGQDQRHFIEDSLLNKRIILSNKGLTEDQQVIINEQTVKYLYSIWVDSNGDIQKFRYSIEQWFDSTMERASGWYKRYTQVILFVIGLMIAVGFNVDSLLITDKLSDDPVLAATISNQAQSYIEKRPELQEQLQVQKKAYSHDKTGNTTYPATLEKFIQSNDSLAKEYNALLKNEIASVSQLLGLGWSRSEKGTLIALPVPNGNSSFILRLIGWLLTALAISLGAPFWFDLLNKFVKVRGTLKTSSSYQTTSGTSFATSSPASTPVQRHG